MKLLNFNIIKLTLCLIIGISIGIYFKISLQASAIIFFILATSFSVYYLILIKKPKSNLGFALLTTALFVSIGVLRTKLYDETHATSHYINSEIDYNTYQDFTLKIKECLKPDNYNTKFFAEVISINGKPSSGKVLVNFAKDIILNELKIDAVVFANTKLSEVAKPKNPFQFDYNSYLKQRNINHQTFIKVNEFILIQSKPQSINGYADSFRDEVNLKLKKQNFSNETLSIINALLLGQRQDISKETYTNYVNAGVIHILAVSGLHVGIIFLILTQIFKPLDRIKNGKKIIKPILITLVLCAFAFIAGLSPSINRAVLMFSIIALSDYLTRPKNTINTLIISAFILLLFKPVYLLDIGFQMSYLAVFAIVIIQPILYKTWTPKNKILDYFWQIFTVTIAAQLGVAPISIFYFHQFPGLFFASNLVIIPVLGIILGFGILVIFLSLFEILPRFLAVAFDFSIEQLNTFIAWIAKFESFLLKDISFSIYHVISSYLVIIGIIYLWKSRTYKATQYALLSILLLSLSVVFSKYKNGHDEFVIFNKSRSTIIGQKLNNHLYISTNIDNLALKENNVLTDYSVGNFIETKSVDSVKNVYSFKDKLILIVDSLGVYNAKTFTPEIVILRDSPRVNLIRLIDSIQPKRIIADGSNYKSYVKRWKATCQNKKIPFHSTYEKGAFILK